MNIFLLIEFLDELVFGVTEAAGAVFIWLAVGLVGDFLLIPLLEKVNGLHYLRLSVILELVLFPAFL
ncbi:MAG: hypothetical protein MUO30_14980, partial [Anaerolineales bacterium]|nr:hypothetical protein [Anaerolineales bacterium]